MLIEVRVIEVMFSQYRNGWESVLKMLIWAYLNSTAVIVFWEELAIEISGDVMDMVLIGLTKKVVFLKVIELQSRKARTYLMVMFWKITSWKF